MLNPLRNASLIAEYLRANHVDRPDEETQNEIVGIGIPAARVSGHCGCRVGSRAHPAC